MFHTYLCKAAQPRVNRITQHNQQIWAKYNFTIFQNIISEPALTKQKVYLHMQSFITFM